MKREYFFNLCKTMLGMAFLVGLGITQLSAQSAVNSRSLAMDWEMANKSNSENSYSFVINSSDAESIATELQNDEGIEAFFPSTKFVGAREGEVKFLVQTKSSQKDENYLQEIITNAGLEPTRIQKRGQ